MYHNQTIDIVSIYRSEFIVIGVFSSQIYSWKKQDQMLKQSLPSHTQGHGVCPIHTNIHNQIFAPIHCALEVIASLHKACWDIWLEGLTNDARIKTVSQAAATSDQRGRACTCNGDMGAEEEQAALYEKSACLVVLLRPV